MKKSKQSASKIKIKIKKNLTKAEFIEIEPTALYGFFAVHSRVCYNYSFCKRTYSVTHIPTGTHLIFSIAWKTKTVELARLLEELVKSGIITSGIKSNCEKTAQDSFPKAARTFLIRADVLCRYASKAKDLKFQELFDELFREELNSKPQLEQKSLFGDSGGK